MAVHFGLVEVALRRAVSGQRLAVHALVPCIIWILKAVQLVVGEPILAQHPVGVCVGLAVAPCGELPVSLDDDVFWLHVFELEYSIELSSALVLVGVSKLALLGRLVYLLLELDCVLVVFIDLLL